MKQFNSKNSAQSYGLEEGVFVNKGSHTIQYIQYSTYSTDD